MTQDYDPAGDPLIALATWLDTMDVTNRTTAVKLRRNERNRLSMLVAHAIAAMVIGPLFTAQTAAPAGMDNAAFAALRLIPDAPYVLGAVLAVGGLILLPATLLRNMTWEIVGLAMLSTWYMAITAGFLLAILWWAQTGYPDPRPGIYPWGVYCHFGIVMIIHIFTLRRMRRRGAS